MSTELHRFKYKDKNGNLVYDADGNVRTYPVYKNDVKTWRRWKNDTKETKKLKISSKYDSIDARIKECAEGKWVTLNLNDMDLKEFPLEYIKHPEKVLYIFCSKNCLKKLPDLDIFKSLKVLDLSHNQLKGLPKLPNLEELCFANNLISDINHIPKTLMRMDCSNNSIKYIPKLEKLTHLNCHKNKIKELPEMDYLSELICYDNRIKIINEYPNLTYLDCSYNRIKLLKDQKNLEELCCEKNELTDLPYFRNLRFVIAYENEIKSLWYMEKLTFAVMDYRYLKSIHEYYIPEFIRNKHILQIILEHKKKKDRKDKKYGKDKNNT